MLLLLATFVLTAVLTYQAVDAAASHRQTAERALRDHATFAAWEYTRLARKELDWHMYNVVKPLFYHEPKNPVALPSPEQLDLSIRTLEQCECSTRKLFTGYFALDLADGRGVWRGRKPDAATRSWIADTIRAHAETHYSPRRWDYVLVLGRPQGRQQTIAYTLRHDTHGAPRVASGVVLDSSVVAEGLKYPFEKAELLPSSLTGETSNVPVLSLSVQDAAGRRLFTAGNTYEGAFAGSDTLGVKFGALTASVVLNPGVAGRLVIGGLPRSRMPLLLSLLTLTTGLVAVTFRQLRKEYELARLRADFVSGVSHELRTPLAQIRMFTETLALERVRSPEEAQRALDIILRESERLSHLVDNVLQFSRAERGTIRLAPESTRLDRLLGDMADAFRPVAAARQATVVFTPDRPVTAVVDPAAVRQVLLNLLDNAVKYGPAGQTIRLELQLDGTWAAISVEDQGPGIPTGERSQVWEPYWRSPRIRQSAVGGSGIGLAVVKELVEAHGGIVAIRDGVSGGARFVIRLPDAVAGRTAPSPADPVTAGT
jgi:signal transduction histidine kinase